MSSLFNQKLICVAISSALLSGLALAIDAEKLPIGLASAFEQALENDPQWRSIQAQLAAEGEELGLARAELLPRVQVTGGYYSKNSDVEFDQAIDDVGSGAGASTLDAGNLDYNGTGVSYGATATQPGFNLAAIKAYRSAKARDAGVELGLEGERQQLILRLATAYFQRLLAAENVSLAQSEQRAFEQQLEQTQQRFKVGLVTLTDVLEAQAAFDQAHVQLAVAENEQAIETENLAIILGEDVPIADLQSDLPLTMRRTELQLWLDEVLQRNVTIRLAQLKVSQSDYALGATRSSYWPTIDLVASYNEIEENQDSTVSQIGLQASWIPFQGGGLKARIQQADYQYQQAQAELRQAEQTIGRDARNQYKSQLTNITRIEAQQRAIASSESALKATKEGYRVGTRNVVDVLNAQRGLFQARRNYSQARHDWVLNRLQGQYLDSSLSKESLETVDQWLKSSTS